MDPDLDALKIHVHTVKADQKHTEANLTRVDGLGEKLRLEVELLQRDKSQLLGIIKMLAGFGVLGAGFVLYIWAQLARPRELQAAPLSITLSGNPRFWPCKQRVCSIQCYVALN
jgi:hypothetical protein